MNNVSLGGNPSSSFPAVLSPGLAPNPAQCNPRPLPGTALSAVLMLDEPFEDGGFLFGSTQAGEALVMRNDDFGLLMGLCAAIPAGLAVWALVVCALIFLQQ